MLVYGRAALALAALASVAVAGRHSAFRASSRASMMTASPIANTAAPLPTAQQLKWQQGNIMALIHFNMATFFKNGDPGCDPSNWNLPNDAGSSNPNSFAPSNLNISNWVDSMKALGINEAVLTAKHGCGFYLWNTSVTLPNGTLYPYHVNLDLYGDVLKKFSDTLGAAGIGHGFYYSLTNNYFLNVADHVVQPPNTLLPGQANVTQAQFEDIVVASVTELWTRYGNLTEIWFDGGYFDMAPRILPILLNNQPNAVAFGGAGLSPNPVRWCGTEGGDPPGWPVIWSTDGGCDNPGNGCPPNTTSAIWNPSAVDFTLQQGDTWFYEPGLAVHPMADLIDLYHKSVGANGRLELDFAISRTGELDPVHSAQYAKFGAWIHACYGTPVASGAPAPGAYSYSLLLQPGGGAATVDRVMLQEDQSQGQRVHSYTVEWQATNGSWAPFSSGVSIGNKRIDIAAAGPVNATALRFTITEAWDAPQISNFAAFAPGPCILPQIRVQFQKGGQCMITNTTFPCAGGAGNSCPLFLGDCSDASSIFNDDGGVIASVTHPGSAINVDCNYNKPHTVAKLLDAGGANSIVFAAGQLVYSPPDGAGSMCLNGGEGPVNPPCNPAEPYATAQINIDACSSPTTQGWTRVVAASAH